MIDSKEVIVEAMVIMDQCIGTPGELLKMLSHNHALQAFASLMRDNRYPEARAKILSMGHDECDLEIVEKAAGEISGKKN